MPKPLRLGAIPIIDAFRHMPALLRRVGMRLALLAALAASTLFAHAGQPCRVAFDLGSSGIRAGASDSPATASVNHDFLGPLWAGQGPESLVAPTIAALRDLTRQNESGSGCQAVGGGFSAWRLALEQDAEKLVAALTRIHAATGVAVLVMPPAREGAYGYQGARQLLGGQLTTSHILDMGGGSLQIAGERYTFADALGQKAWHRQLCEALRQTSVSPCALQPLSAGEIEQARALLERRLAGLATALPEPVTITAISRPVSRGLLPAVQAITGDQAGSRILKTAGITETIRQLAPLSPEESGARTGSRQPHLAYLLSDLLLVEGLLRQSGVDQLRVAEADITNLPGLLADERAFAWGGRYACYLHRLRSMGLHAYASEPASCR